MARPKSAALPPATRWEANCLFCGEGLADEGAGFLDHVARKQGCHDQYDAWVAHIGDDWGGGD